MTPESYRAAARRLRRLADRVEQTAHATTPQERRARTLAVHALARAARELYEKHSRSASHDDEDDGTAQPRQAAE